ncbi:MAG: aminotransferase class I/II-fold pyridoxal phosphate-dependent enzyme [Proteobacteria bacterium]|nr:aminotransferase class I/II-fold pyridoxal phosphate-dependent enzyme [Pseudomonadota bacterium]
MHKDYKANIKHYLDPESSVFLFWKGRVALYAILRALGIKEGDEVILPALTCVVVPNAIMYIGAKPVYVDVDPRTYNMDPAKIEDKITKRTKVILAQNTFGLSSDLDEICGVARKHGLRVVEDCAHGFGGNYKGRPNGTIVDAAFFSTQWNKPFSTGIGGFAVTRNPELSLRLSELEKQAALPSFAETLMLKMQLIAKDYFLNQTTYWTAITTYRFLSRHNVVVGSSQGEELKSPRMPKGFLKGLSAIQAARGIKELKRFDSNLNHRKAIAQLYKNILGDLGIEVPFEPDYAEHIFTKFPLLVKDREKFLADAGKSKIEIGDWFLSPIHPVTDDVHRWHYHYGENPIAEKLSAHLVNLHTHTKIDKYYVEKIESFLRRNRNNIFESSEQCLNY